MSDELNLETELAKAILAQDGFIDSATKLSFDDYNFLHSKAKYEAWQDHILKEAKPFSMVDFNQQLYNQRIQELKDKYHFETKGWDNNLRCIIFTRTVEREEIHEVILEDERDDEKIHDWLIFSYLKDSITDFGGMPDDAQYPLELGEYRLFVRLIRSLECLYSLEKEEDHSLLSILTETDLLQE